MLEARRLEKPVLHSARNGFSVALYQPSPLHSYSPKFTE